MGNLMAQELKTLTLDDLLPGGETYRYAENIYGLQWWGDVLVKPDIDRMVTVDLQNGLVLGLTDLSLYGIYKL